jgi:type I restriction enzyme, R subunit
VQYVVLTVIGKTETQLATSNFSFLEPYEMLLPKLGVQAERHFAEDPATCIVKLQQFADLLAQRTALTLGVSFSPSNDFLDLLNHLRSRGVARQVLDIFHRFSSSGGDTANGEKKKQVEALHELKLAKALAEWYVRLATNDPSFCAPPFVIPPDSRQVAAELKDQLEELTKRMSLAEYAPALPPPAEGVHFDLNTFNEQLSKNGRITRTQFRIDQSNLDPTTVATFQLTLSEDDTLSLIEEQLRNRGWEADRNILHFALGCRPAKDRQMAIAGWPTDNGIASYALFVGPKCVGVIAADCEHKNVRDAIDQAERYSRGFQFVQGAEPLKWPCGEYRIPFVFATNGKSYVKQIENESGVWFRDTRLTTNAHRALVDWPNPNTLGRFYGIDSQKAHAVLKAMPFEFGFQIRPYQIKAIEAIEGALRKDRRRVLIAMAPGTGKTKTTVALLYRLLLAKRVRSVCYVIDGENLKEQAIREFKSTNVMADRTIAEVFGIDNLNGIAPEPSKKLHICTVQELMKSVLHAPKEVTSIDQYDLIVFDECHYGLRYSQALEHFDAIKIGLTATPTLHTVDIFGEPLFNYSYREAVLAGYLIDHEPPVQVKTRHAGESIYQTPDDSQTIDSNGHEIDLSCVPDDVSIETEYFDRQIGTLEFNRSIAQELADKIDPKSPEKTLVFARDEAHADILVDQLKRAFDHAHGRMDERAITKITAKHSRVSELIDAIRDEEFPKVIVTDDLLTTGIDLPNITNLVLVRRVKSRILYEQMLGRATRPCEKISKQRFRIFDAVDLYRQFAHITSMKPIAVNPSVTIKQLFEQIQRLPDESHLDLVYQQMIVKLRMRIKELDSETIEKYTTEAGETPEETLTRFLGSVPSDVSNWLKEKPDLGQILEGNGSATPPKNGQQSTRTGFQPVALKNILQSVRSYLPR